MLQEKEARGQEEAGEAAAYVTEEQRRVSEGDTGDGGVLFLWFRPPRRVTRKAHPRLPWHTRASLCLRGLAFHSLDLPEGRSLL